mmetsp:Transcript_9825/g.24819  ORF Transcript_9825/g.24819 Transcript_9825/m.24819 type:complete len:217 (+) Transcript_9825:176-826(+)
MSRVARCQLESRILELLASAVKLRSHVLELADRLLPGQAQRAHFALSRIELHFLELGQLPLIRGLDRAHLPLEADLVLRLARGLGLEQLVPQRLEAPFELPTPVPLALERLLGAQRRLSPFISLALEVALVHAQQLALFLHGAQLAVLDREVGLCQARLLQGIVCLPQSRCLVALEVLCSRLMPRRERRLFVDLVAVLDCLEVLGVVLPRGMSRLA